MVVLVYKRRYKRIGEQYYTKIEGTGMRVYFADDCRVPKFKKSVAVIETTNCGVDYSTPKMPTLMIYDYRQMLEHGIIEEGCYIWDID